ncbi:MAG: ParB N-terminal domain-containing protein [Desulfobacteraceae bacterium]
MTKQDSVLVEVNQINENPGPYCMSFGFDLKPLIHSVDTFGLVNSPIVTKDGEGRVEVVAGYRRILALKHLQWKQIPCRDLSRAGFSPLDLLLLNLHDNLTTRPFNAVEKGMILNRLGQHVSREEIMKDFMPLLDLPCHGPTLEIFLGLEKLDRPIKESLVHARISFQTAKAFVDMDAESRATLLDWIVGMRLNANQQSQFIAYTADISMREQKKISSFLGEKEILDILNDTKLNNPQKSKLLLNFLRSRRFPLLTHSEDVFREKTADLGLPEGVRIYHPPFFEDPDYRLEILFKNGKKLREKIDALGKVKGLESLGDPWEEDEV